MPLLTIYFIVLAISLYPLIIIILGLKKKIFWVLPVGNLVISTFILYEQIISHSSTSPSLKEQFRVFFVNDSSTLFYFVYIPCIVVGTLLPILIGIIIKIKNSIQKITRD